MSFHPNSTGRKVSTFTVTRWIKACIATAYKRDARPVPVCIFVHSTRSTATTAAWSTQASISDIRWTATWTSPTPFIRHYKIDTFASEEAAFGRRVLQHVHSSLAVGSSQPPSHGT